MSLALTHLDDGSVLVDGGDLGCARLLRRLRDVVADLPAGTRVLLDTTDPVAPIDLPAWCRLTGHGYLGVVEARPRPERPATTRYGVAVAAGARPTSPTSPWRLS